MGSLGRAGRDQIPAELVGWALDDPGEFIQDAADFGLDVQNLIGRTITPADSDHVVRIEFRYVPPRALIEWLPRGSDTGDDSTSSDAPPGRRVAILVSGQPVATVGVRIGLRPDSTGRYLAVTTSAFSLYSALDRTPLFRLDFHDEMNRAPCAHWQVHAERGALSSLLTVGGRKRPHSLASLHLPVGGRRFRPGLEDFLQFVVEELGADAPEGWRDALTTSREVWRRRQVATCARDVPAEAARALRGLGYTVNPPPDGDPQEQAATTREW